MPWHESRFVKPYVPQLSLELVDLLNHVLHTDPDLVRCLSLEDKDCSCSHACCPPPWCLPSCSQEGSHGGGGRLQAGQQRPFRAHASAWCWSAPARVWADPTPCLPLPALQRADLDAINAHPWMRK